MGKFGDYWNPFGTGDKFGKYLSNADLNSYGI
jgi:hypothetical protein